MKEAEARREDAVARTRVYRMSWWSRTGAILLIALGSLVFLQFWYQDPPANQLTRGWQNLLWVGIFLAGMWWVMSVFWSRITLTSEAIEVRTLLGRDRLPLDAILGRREYVSRGSKGATIQHFVLVPRDNQWPRLDFTDRFSLDDEFKSWYSHLPDLNANGADGSTRNAGPSTRA